MSPDETMNKIIKPTANYNSKSCLLNTVEGGWPTATSCFAVNLLKHAATSDACLQPASRSPSKSAVRPQSICSLTQVLLWREVIFKETGGTCHWAVTLLFLARGQHHCFCWTTPVFLFVWRAKGSGCLGMERLLLQRQYKLIFMSARSLGPPWKTWSISQDPICSVLME